MSITRNEYDLKALNARRSLKQILKKNNSEYATWVNVENGVFKEVDLPDGQEKMSKDTTVCQLPPILRAAIILSANILINDNTTIEEYINKSEEDYELPIDARYMNLYEIYKLIKEHPEAIGIFEYFELGFLYDGDDDRKRTIMEYSFVLEKYTLDIQSASAARVNWKEIFKALDMDEYYKLKICDFFLQNDSLSKENKETLVNFVIEKIMRTKEGIENGSYNFLFGLQNIVRLSGMLKKANKFFSIGRELINISEFVKNEKNSILYAALGLEIDENGNVSILENIDDFFFEIRKSPLEVLNVIRENVENKFSGRELKFSEEDERKINKALSKIGFEIKDNYLHELKLPSLKEIFPITHPHWRCMEIEGLFGSKSYKIPEILDDTNYDSSEQTRAFIGCANNDGWKDTELKLICRCAAFEIVNSQELFSMLPEVVQGQKSIKIDSKGDIIFRDAKKINPYMTYNGDELEIDITVTFMETIFDMTHVVNNGKRIFSCKADETYWYREIYKRRKYFLKYGQLFQVTGHYAYEPFDKLASFINKTISGIDHIMFFECPIETKNLQIASKTIQSEIEKINNLSKDEKRKYIKDHFENEVMTLIKVVDTDDDYYQPSKIEYEVFYAADRVNLYSLLLPDYVLAMYAAVGVIPNVRRQPICDTEELLTFYDDEKNIAQLKTIYERSKKDVNFRVNFTENGLEHEECAFNEGDYFSKNIVSFARKYIEKDFQMLLEKNTIDINRQLETDAILCKNNDKKIILKPLEFDKDKIFENKEVGAYENLKKCSNEFKNFLLTFEEKNEDGLKTNCVPLFCAYYLVAFAKKNNITLSKCEVENVKKFLKQINKNEKMKKDISERLKNEEQRKEFVGQIATLLCSTCNFPETLAHKILFYIFCFFTLGTYLIVSNARHRSPEKFGKEIMKQLNQTYDVNDDFKELSEKMVAEIYTTQFPIS